MGIGADRTRRVASAAVALTGVGSGATLYGGTPMSIRIEIELTSSAPDGSWTWRAAGAREPRGVLDGSILPAGVDGRRPAARRDREGHRRHPRAVGRAGQGEGRARADLLELLPTEETFEPVVQHRAPRRPRRRARAARAATVPTATAATGATAAPRPRPRAQRPGDRRRRPHGRATRPDAPRPAARAATTAAASRPHFTPPPEVPQRPKPKRLRPGKQHRTDVLAVDARGAAPGRRARAAGHGRRAPAAARGQRPPEGRGQAGDARGRR